MAAIASRIAFGSYQARAIDTAGDMASKLKKRGKWKARTMTIDRIFKPTNQFEEHRDVWRICYASAGFRDAYGQWPTQVKAHKDLCAYVQELLTERAFQELTEKVDLMALPDFGDVIAEDGNGRSWSYGSNKSPQSISAAFHWIWGVEI